MSGESVPVRESRGGRKIDVNEEIFQQRDRIQSICDQIAVHSVVVMRAVANAIRDCNTA